MSRVRLVLGLIVYLVALGALVVTLPDDSGAVLVLVIVGIVSVSVLALISGVGLVAALRRQDAPPS